MTRNRSSGSLIVIAIVVLAAVSVTVSPTPAHAPPRSVCEPCHDDLEYAAGEVGVAIDVTESTARMRVHRNGSATWTVTSRYEAAGSVGYSDAPERNASALVRNRDLLREVTLRAIDEQYGPNPDTDRLRSVRANASAITFTFRESGVASETPGGVVLLDRYHRSGRGDGWHVDVDRLRIIGPERSVVANDATDAIGSDIADAENRTLTIEGDTEEPPSFQRDEVYVAFTDPGPAAEIISATGIALATLPTVVRAFSLTHLPGLVVLLALLGMLYWLRAGSGGAPSRRRARRWAVGSVAVYVAGTVLLFPPVTVSGMFLVFGTIFLVIVGLAIAVANWVAYRVSGAP
jgi:hypothetical protein